MENPLARRLLAGEFTDGDTVIVDVQENDDGKLEPDLRRPAAGTDRGGAAGGANCK